MAAGFCGGVGGSNQELCGALSGAVMVIGGLFGRASVEEDDQQAVDLSACYRDRFLKEFGHTQCAELKEKVVDPPGGLGSCAALVKVAAGLLLDLMAAAG
jgi:C_GCAxxG_C_C family probable redox protein